MRTRKTESFPLPTRLIKLGRSKRGFINNLEIENKALINEKLNQVSKRHQKIYGECLKDIRNSDIRRLARRSGVKRISILTYDEIRKSLKIFFKDIVVQAIVYSGHSKRKTVVAMDIVYAMKSRGRTIYGYGG
jgi:histone H4